MQIWNERSNSIRYKNEKIIFFWRYIFNLYSLVKIWFISFVGSILDYFGPKRYISENFVISVIFELPQKRVQMSYDIEIPIRMKFVVDSSWLNNQFWNFDVFYVYFWFTKTFNYLYLSSLKRALNGTHKWNKSHFYKRMQFKNISTKIFFVMVFNECR